MPSARALSSFVLRTCSPLLVLAVAPALAEAPIQKRALPGQTVMLDGYASDEGMQADCISRPGSVGILRPPSGGRLSQRYEDLLLGNVLSGDASSPCRNRPKSAAALYYTARHGFSGVDRVTVDVQFRNGRHNTFTYLITVEAPPEQAAPAQASRQQPINPYDARPAERVAPVAAPPAQPASEGRNASDFLSRVAREGQRAPAVTESAARPIPEAKGAADTPATPAQPVLPARVDAYVGTERQSVKAEPAPPAVQSAPSAPQPSYGPRL